MGGAPEVTKLGPGAAHSTGKRGVLGSQLRPLATLPAPVKPPSCRGLGSGAVPPTTHSEGRGWGGRGALTKNGAWAASRFSIWLVS